MTARILNSVLLVVLGLLLGTLGTLGHAAVLTVASARLPAGLVVSLLAVACLLTGLRLTSAGRGPAFLSALGVLVAVAVFSMRSFGGSVLIPSGPSGVTWIVGTVVIAALVLAWPRISRHREPVAASEGPVVER